MEKDEKNILIKYIKEIQNYESYIKGEKKIFAAGYKKEFFGYLINLEEYKKLKADIKYENNLVNYEKYKSIPMDSEPIKKNIF